MQPTSAFSNGDFKKTLSPSFTGTCGRHCVIPELSIHFFLVAFVTAPASALSALTLPQGVLSLGRKDNLFCWGTCENPIGGFTLRPSKSESLQEGARPPFQNSPGDFRTSPRPRAALREMLASAHVCLCEPVTFRWTCAHPRRPVTEGVFGICSFLGMAFSLFARQHRKILFTAHGRMAEGATELRVHAGRPPPPTAGCSGHPALCAPLRSSTLLTAGADPRLGMSPAPPPTACSGTLNSPTCPRSG